MATHYIDPVDGDDGTADDTNINTPRKTWVLTGHTVGDTYAGKAGTTAQLTALLNITSANVTITTYGTGAKHYIDGSVNSDIRTVRVAAAGVILDNVKVSASQNTPFNCVISATGAGADCEIKDCEMAGSSTNANSTCIDWAIGAPVKIYNNYCHGANTGIRIGSAAMVPAGISLVHNNIIDCVPNDAQKDTSDGLILLSGGLAAKDWNYGLHIYNNRIINWGESAVDLVGGAKVLFYKNNIGTRNKTVTPSSISAMILGKTDNSAIGSIVMSNKILAESLEAGTVGIGARGLVDGYIIGNVISNYASGLRNSSSGANNNVYANNYVFNSTNGFVNTDLTTGTELINSVISASSNSIELDSGSLTYSNNCIDAGAIAGSPTDGGGNITATPSGIDSNYDIPQDSVCVGTGKYWWSGVSLNLLPFGNNSEPFSNVSVDIGPNQTIFDPFHPVNLLKST